MATTDILAFQFAEYVKQIDCRVAGDRGSYSQHHIECRTIVEWGVIARAQEIETR